MESEHLRNVRFVRVALGWFIGAAVTSLAFFGIMAFGLMSRDGEGNGWGLAAISLGYGVAGWYLARSGRGAPILHAVAMGVFSLVVWLLVNLVPGSLMHAQSWGAGSGFAAGLLLQMVAAAVGGYLGASQPPVASS
jgi:hypothetical protein